MFTKYHETMIRHSFNRYKDTKFPDMWESLGHTYFKEHIGTDIVKYAAWVKEYKTRYVALTEEIRMLKKLTKEHSRALHKERIGDDAACGCKPHLYVRCESVKKTWDLYWKRSEACSLWLMRNVGKKYYHKQEWQRVGV